MKILLTGANGQVGYELWRTLQFYGEVIPTTRTGVEIEGMPTIALDLANPQDIEKKLNVIAPNLICNAAAYTAVDAAEDDHKLAHAINVTAPYLFAKYSVINDSLLIHYSTDYVFAGNANTPWLEDDDCNPQGVYAETKMFGEQAITDSGCQHMIFRTAWVYSQRGNNFLNSMLKLASQKDELNIVDDQIGSPTWATSLAQATALTLKTPIDGIYHMTSSGKTSWCKFARKILTQAKNLDLIINLPKVSAITTSQYPTLAKRPAYSVLNCQKLHDTFDIKMPNWQTSLQLCMQHIRRET
ncbi:MAG: dTDP-4-dehydrorhamnose reductase [Proteobacteria bacterium]|nr:dTDP-4-dehydrorhamnose reductase [Pseudomonadota bacterium]